MLITGGNLVAGSTQVELAQLTDEDPGEPATQTPSVSSWTVLTTLTATTRSLTATVPASWSNGVYALRLRNGASADTIHLVNAPDPWFVQGDMGDMATPGGSFYVAGTGLERTGGLPPQAALVAKTGGSLIAKLPLAERITTTTGYALRFSVPASVPEGEYQLWLHNGRGGAAAWVRFSNYVTAPVETVIVKKAAIWPLTTRDVSSQTGANDDEKFAKAIADLAGGGRLFVPAGTYHLTKPLVLPPRTLLVGAGRSETVLQWTADPGTSGLVVGRTIQFGSPGRGTFSIEDMTLQASPDFRRRVVERTNTEEPGWIRRVTIKAPIVTDGVPWDKSPTAIYLEDVKNTQLDDLVMESHFCLFGRQGVSYMRMERSSLTWFGLHTGLSGRSHNLMIHDNQLMQRTGPGDSTGLNLTTFYGDPDFSGPYSKDILWANNTSVREASIYPVRRSQGYTSDGANGIFVGKIVDANGVTLTLASKTAVPTNPAGQKLSFSWAGAAALIVDGRGAGQWRYVTEAGPGVTTVKIDRPWDVVPDGNSTLTIVNLQGRMLMIDNVLEAEPQFDDFYIAVDAIRAGNQLGTVGSDSSFASWAGNVYVKTATFPSWHYQSLGNAIVRGTNFWFISQSTDFTEGADYRGISGAAHVYRGNTNTSPGISWLSIGSQGHTFADVVVEKNQLDKITFVNSNANALPTSLSGVVLRQNLTPSNVATPVLPTGPINGLVTPP